MIGYTLKHVLELVPEVLPLVKQAHIEQDYPVIGKDNCLASAMVIEYKKLNNEIVDYDALTKVAEAVTMYGLEDTIFTLTNKMKSRGQAGMLKQASVETTETWLTKQAGWEGNFSGFPNIKDLSEQAEIMFEKAASVGAESMVGEKVKLYAGQGYLVKEAVLNSLGARFATTKNDVFVKLASAVGRESELISSPRTIKSLCSVVTRLDSENNLFSQGFDFYKEAMISKEAGFTKCMVKVSGKDYPLEKILSIPDSYLDSYMDKGFAKELKNDPNSAKYLVESLPVDSQQILSSILKNA